jgi:Ca2+/Na+ antiporter
VTTSADRRTLGDPGESASPRDHFGIVFWVCLVAGWSIIITTLVMQADNVWLRGNLDNLGIWVGGTLIVHDVLLAPLVITVGWGVGRVAPKMAVGPIRGALAISALVVLFAYPLLRGFGRRAANPTILPLDYRREVVIVLISVWLVATVIVILRMLRSRGNGPITR